MHEVGERYYFIFIILFIINIIIIIWFFYWWIQTQMDRHYGPLINHDPKVRINSKKHTLNNLKMAIFPFLEALIDKNKLNQLKNHTF